jgi:hypothetical protein
MQLLFKKEITYWPAKAGWHEVTAGKATNYQWYTWDKNSWKALPPLISKNLPINMLASILIIVKSALNKQFIKAARLCPKYTFLSYF